jgi:negative regulator of sigma E activity
VELEKAAVKFLDSPWVWVLVALAVAVVVVVAVVLGVKYGKPKSGSKK